MKIQHVPFMFATEPSLAATCLTEEDNQSLLILDSVNGTRISTWLWKNVCNLSMSVGNGCWICSVLLGSALKWRFESLDASIGNESSGGLAGTSIPILSYLQGRNGSLLYEYHWLLSC